MRFEGWSCTGEERGEGQVFHVEEELRRGEVWRASGNANI